MSTVASRVPTPRSTGDRPDAGELPARPLGPGSVVWYAAGDQRVLLFAVRALLLQVAHPMVGAGVFEHSVYKTDPYGRLWRTTESVNNQVYGGVRAAEEGRRLIRMHTQIKGVDADGRRYHALDPTAYLWVHATMLDTWRLMLREVGPGLTDEQDQQLFEEWHRMALLIGVRPSVLPSTRAEFEAMWEQMLPRLENNPVVQDLLHVVPRRPPFTPIPQRLFDAVGRPLLRRQRELVACTLDPGLRARIGLPAPTPAMRRRVRRTLRVARLGNRLPDWLRQAPLARLAVRRTLRDPRTRPEPVAYP
ncbi:oxygenase MpaB family protein [Nocardioides ferulae]|uniref:oxygenase MpaB family protein n=1 Tax=Nocardioides ferulae TaxID=2340821 RepID=UPI000EAE1C59|nr:oxygenase MpaB family protein [Nocardioides ferulae]